MLVAEQARVAVYHAISEARRSNAAVVDTGHLLAGVIAARDAVVRAVWQELGVDQGRLRDALMAPGRRGASTVRMRHALAARRTAVLAGQTPGARPSAFSVGARRVLSDAFLLARVHRARRLGAGHLLLAIAGRRDDDAARALSALGVDLATLLHVTCMRLTSDAGGHTCGSAARSSAGRSGSR